MKAILPNRQVSQSILKVFLALIISGAAMAAGISAGAIVGKQDRPAMRLTGIVTDTSCGATHGGKTQGDADCTRMCVRLGADYALAVGEKVYVLQGHRPELNTLAGETVVVSGKVVNRYTIAVDSVTPYIVWAGLYTK